ncbi:MAG: hypothetical protein JWN25_3277 [Verrucomicrobiales bacterium]|nr:hypothetical protein [Verrucomicrobiales bacterium]
MKNLSGQAARCLFSITLAFPLLAYSQEAAKPVATPAAITATAVVAATTQSSSFASIKTLALEVSVIRYKPNKPERVLDGFRDLGGNLTMVIDKLKADGEISILYYGTREMRLEDKSKVKFDALETRPVMIVGKPGTPLPPVTSYGLNLEILAKSFEGERFGLSWEGSVMWSPEIVDGRKGEKFLNFISGAATVASKAGALAGDNKMVSSASDIGLNFAQLFSPKSGPVDAQIYELPVNKTVSFSSSRNCKSGELVVNATTAEMGSKEAQTILLLIWPTLMP